MPSNKKRSIQLSNLNFFLPALDVFNEQAKMGVSRCLSDACDEGSGLNTEADKLCQSITDGRDVEKLLERVSLFDMGNAYTHCWNVEADGDIGVGAGGPITGFYSEPGKRLGCQLHQRVRLAACACRALTKHFYLCLEAGTSTLLDDGSHLVGDAIKGCAVG